MKSEFKLEDNCLDVIRLISALQIAVLHLYDKFKFPLGEKVLGFPVVYYWTGILALFTISGFLIPASIEKSRTKEDFLLKRLLRIYPALFVSTFLSVVFILIFLGGGDNMIPLKSLFIWIVAQMTVLQFYTPNALKVYGAGNPNGALWSISTEIQLYVVFALIWKKLKQFTFGQWIALLIAVISADIAFEFVSNILPEMVVKIVSVSFLPFCFAFFTGVFLYVKCDIMLPLIVKKFWKLLVLYIVWMNLVFLFPSMKLGYRYDVVSGLMFCVLVIAAGYKFGKVRVKYEISYGIYVYHCIFMNLILELQWDHSFWSYPLALVLTVTFAMLSYHLIEKPFAAKKNELYEKLYSLAYKRNTRKVI